jgi:predicted acylesterase/phospholipase RssA
LPGPVNRETGSPGGVFRGKRAHPGYTRGMTPPAPSAACVLSGGALKAVSQLGVLEYLAVRGIGFGAYMGCSGGAIVAAMTASGLPPEETLAAFRKRGSEGLGKLNAAAGGGLLAGFLGRLTGGLRDAGTVAGIIREYLPADDFDALPTELVVNAVHLRSGLEVYFTGQGREGPALDLHRVCRRVPVSRAVAASACLPVLFKPLELTECVDCPERTCGLPEDDLEPRGRHFVDGGLVSHLPVDPALGGGSSLVMCVNISIEGPARSRPVTDWSLPDTLLKSGDILLQGQVRRRLAGIRREGVRVVSLSPPVWDSGLFHIRDMDRSFEAGRRTAREFLLSLGLPPEGEIGLEDILTRLESPVTVFASRTGGPDPGIG